VTVDSLNVFVFIIKSGVRIISIYFELQRYSVSNYFPVFSTTNFEKSLSSSGGRCKRFDKNFLGKPF